MEEGEWYVEDKFNDSNISDITFIDIDDARLECWLLQSI